MQLAVGAQWSDVTQCCCSCAAAPNRKDASKSQQEFVRGLPQAIINDTAVVLHSGTFFLGQPDLGNTLMVRPFWYPKVEQAMRHHFDNGGRALGIVGNPGEHDGFSAGMLALQSPLQC
jgi:hypothetical protein